MEGFSGALDDILVSIYRNVLRLEKQMLKRSRQTTLSVSEVHLILCLGDAKGDGCTVTELARSLGITVSSATIAVSKLIQKGFVRKVRSQKDSRIVRVYLTETGKGVDTYNRICRRQLVDEISRRILRQVVVFPAPVSPTMPSVCPSSISKEIPFTAWMTASSVVY